MEIQPLRDLLDPEAPERGLPALDRGDQRGVQATHRFVPAPVLAAGTGLGVQVAAQRGVHIPALSVVAL